MGWIEEGEGEKGRIEERKRDGENRGEKESEGGGREWRLGIKREREE